MEYPPLFDNSIRVLDFAFIDGHSEPQCSFRVVSLDDAPDYTAVSYYWGDPTPASTIKFLNGESLPISQTIRTLFYALSKTESELRLTMWIDALCINQEDMAERESQVLMMGNVFSSATKVFLWLGEGDVTSATAFRSLKSSIPDEDGLAALFHLLSRSWFQRVWVIQEITVAKSIQVGCGDDHTSFDHFCMRILELWSSKYLDITDEDDLSLRGLWAFTSLIHIRWEYQEKLRRDGVEAMISYEDLLQLALHCEASDNRDKVFAFRGIADTRPVPRPNYTISTEEVLVKTAEALLCNGTSLDLLALCGVGNQSDMAGLPSWAPDLRSHSWAQPLAHADIADWNAGGSIKVSPQADITESGHCLRLRVQFIGQVDATCPAFESWTVSAQQEAVRAVLALRRRLPVSLTDEAWKEKVMTTLIAGVDIDDVPLVKGTRQWDSYVKGFAEWLDWLQSSSCQDDLVKIKQNIYHRTIGPCFNGEAAFMTSSGHLCVGVWAISEGDMLCTVPGCRIPLVLRSDATSSSDEESKDRWLLVGWCFADGLMFGEAEVSANTVREIVLR